MMGPYDNKRCNFFITIVSSYLLKCIEAGGLTRYL